MLAIVGTPAPSNRSKKNNYPFMHELDCAAILRCATVILHLRGYLLYDLNITTSNMTFFTFHLFHLKLKHSSWSSLFLFPLWGIIKCMIWFFCFMFCVTGPPFCGLQAIACGRRYWWNWLSILFEPVWKWMGRARRWWWRSWGPYYISR